MGEFVNLKVEVKREVKREVRGKLRDNTNYYSLVTKSILIREFVNLLICEFVNL